MTPVKSVESGAHQMLNGAEAVGQPGQEVAYEPASGGPGNKLSIQPPSPPSESNGRLRTTFDPVRSVWHWHQAEAICNAPYRSL